MYRLKTNTMCSGCRPRLALRMTIIIAHFIRTLLSKWIPKNRTLDIVVSNSNYSNRRFPRLLFQKILLRRVGSVVVKLESEGEVLMLLLRSLYSVYLLASVLHLKVSCWSVVLESWLLNCRKNSLVIVVSRLQVGY